MVVRLWLERAGLRVDETSIGDASPVQAIADILVQRGPFSGIIISTQPRRISRWLRLDVQTIAPHRFSLPVISVIGQKPWLLDLRWKRFGYIVISRGSGDEEADSERRAHWRRINRPSAC